MRHRITAGRRRSGVPASKTLRARSVTCDARVACELIRDPGNFATRQTCCTPFCRSARSRWTRRVSRLGSGRWTAPPSLVDRYTAASRPCGCKDLACRAGAQVHTRRLVHLGFRQCLSHDCCIAPLQHRIVPAFVSGGPTLVSPQPSACSVIRTPRSAGRWCGHPDPLRC